MDPLMIAQAVAGEGIESDDLHARWIPRAIELPSVEWLLAQIFRYRVPVAG